MVRDVEAGRRFDPDAYSKRGRLRAVHYERELELLQVELVKLQEWVRETGHRVVVVFEGRDAAGKGGVIQRITERTNPRTVNGPSGTSSATSNNSPPPGRSSCSTALGTTGPGSSG